MALNTKIRGNQINDAFFGNGLKRNGSDANIAEVSVDDSSIEIYSDALRIKALGITTGMLANDAVDKTKINADIAGNGIIQNIDGSLELNPDNVSIEIASGEVLQVKAGGISNDMLAGSISNDKLASDYIQTSEVDNSTVEWSGTVLQVKADGITANEIDETDDYQFSGSFEVTTTPTSDYDVANKAYVDSVAQGLDPKDSVYAKSTVADGNITLSGVSGQSLDGQNLSADQRVLLTNQTDAKENGIWIVKADAWVRPADFATDSGVASAFVFVEKGDDYADTGWVCTNDSGTDIVGTDNLTFVQFSGAGQVVAGTALSKDGDTLNVNVDDSTIGVNGSDELYVKADGITKTEINADIAGDGLVQNIDGSLELNPDDSTVEVVSGDVLQVKDLGITTAKIANDAVDKTKINADVAGNGIVQNVDGSLELNPDNSSIEIASGEVLQVKALGITNAMLAGAIDDTKLAVDYIRVSEVDGVTLEFASGNVLQVKALGIDTAQLANEAVTEAKMDIFNAPSNGQVLGYTANGLEWVSGTGDSVTEGDIQVENESSNCDGNNTDFTLSNTPLQNSVQVFLNGLLQEVGSGKDYTLSGTTVSFAQAPLLGDILIIHYIINN